MKNKFLVFSLLLVFGLLILSYPQVSLAQQAASVKTGTPAVGKTIANATGTVLESGSDEYTGGVGFVWGTASGVYCCTSTDFTVDTYTTSSDFTLSTTTLSKGTLYYHKAYASTSESTVYGSEVSFLTGIDSPTGFGVTYKDTNAIYLSWVKGAGADKTIVRYRTDAYPASITNGTLATSSRLTSVNVGGLTLEQTYYFRAWSSTTDSEGQGLSTSSDSYGQVTVATVRGFVASGARGFIAPTVFPDSLVVNQGAESTQTREVELSLRASDVLYMSICNDNLFLGPLETYTTTKTWTLTKGDGEKTVYIKFVSPDGVNSAVISETIILESVAEEEIPEEEVAEEVLEEVVEEVPEEVVEEVVEEEVVAEKPITEMTIEELRVKITEVMTQIADLQAQLSEGGEVAVTGCTITSFGRALKVGMSGDDVKCLQIVLNTASDTQLNASGVGSPGNETSYFGSLTQGGVITFQEKYADDILASWGLTSGTGYVGSTTRDKLNELLGQ